MSKNIADTAANNAGLTTTRQASRTDHHAFEARHPDKIEWVTETPGPQYSPDLNPVEMEARSERAIAHRSGLQSHARLGPPQSTGRTFQRFSFPLRRAQAAAPAQPLRADLPGPAEANATSLCGL